jgi:hypothetical protein
MSKTRDTSRLSKHCALLALLFILLGCNLSERLKRMNKPGSSESKTVNLYEGTAMQEAAAKFKEKIGGKVMALSLTTYGPSYSGGFAVLQAQDPKKPENIDSYEYKGGTVSGPTPVSMMGSGKLEDNLFDLDEVNFAATPALAKEALTRLNIEGGEVHIMVIRRNLPFSKDIRWHVSVEGPRRKGFADADKNGVIKEAKLY